MKWLHFTLNISDTYTSKESSFYLCIRAYFYESVSKVKISAKRLVAPRMTREAICFHELRSQGSRLNCLFGSWLEKVPLRAIVGRKKVLQSIFKLFQVRQSRSACVYIYCVCNDTVEDVMAVEHLEGSSRLSSRVKKHNKTCKRFKCTHSVHIHHNRVNLDAIFVVSPVPASIYKVSEDITVNEGSNVTLSCLASGRPDPAITWRLLNPSGNNHCSLEMLDPRCTRFFHHG